MPTVTRQQVRRLLAPVVCVVLLWAVGFMLPDLLGLLPSFILRAPVAWTAIALILIYASARAWAVAHAASGGRAAVAEAIFRRADRLALLAVDKGALTVAAFAFWGALLLAWLPHFLVWPLWRNADAFAIIAMAWDSGVRPYRDILSYNFPGATYEHWFLGKLVGWGSPVAFQALDASYLIGLGVVLILWSRRRLGGPLPGLLAHFGFMTFYLAFPFIMTGQRDWHAACLATIAVLALEAWPGRRGRIASAIVIGAAASIRPHAILFLPALISAIDEARATGEPAGKSLRAIAEWCAAAGISVLLWFSPVIFQGLLDDLLRNLRIAMHGGPYSRSTAAEVAKCIREQFEGTQTRWALWACAFLAVAWTPERRRMARTWGLAIAGVWFYRPLHPVLHVYLAQPLALVVAVAAALPAAWFLGARSLRPPIRLLIVLVLFYEAMPVIPDYCRPLASLRAVGPLVRGVAPVDPPPGADFWARRGKSRGEDYTWEDFNETIDYLRHRVSPRTSVANLLKRIPHPGINGASGRQSPFLVESGIISMWHVDLNHDARFAAELERATDSVVVWSPTEIHYERRLELPKTTAVVLAHYRPEAKFGLIEIWRRKADADAKRPAP